MCVDCHKQTHFGRPWSADEILQVRELYKYIPVPEIAARVGRTEAAITRRAHMIGLSIDRRTHWNDNWMFVTGNPYQEMSLELVAYISGVFDGEGDLTIKRDRYWTAGITNTNQELIDFLGNSVTFSTINWSDRKKPCKRCGTWRLSGNFKVLRFLSVMKPYLIVKQAKATEAIESILRLEGDVFEFYKRYSKASDGSDSR